MTDTIERLNTIRDHLHTGAVGQREVWEAWLTEAADELARLTALSQNNAHSWDSIVKERNELRDEIKRLLDANKLAKDVITQLTGSKAMLQVEIDRLRGLNDDQQKILDGTERRESEYLALIEKHATEIDAWKEAWLKLQIENNNLMHERHTTKQMLEDVIRHHCVGTITPPATPPNKRSA